MKTIAVATFARSEYSSLRPLLPLIQKERGLRLRLIVSGSHLDAASGHSVDEIVADGFPIAERIKMPLSSDSPAAIAAALGAGTAAFGKSFARRKPDLLLLVGDRTELLVAASAALLFRIPIAHLSGGDITEGAIDNQVRYALTELSHLHFVSMREHAERLLQMGEESWRVRVTGDPALDALRGKTLLGRKELSRTLGVDLTPPVILVTFHPATLGEGNAAAQTDQLLSALSRVPGTLVFTHPNSDTGSRAITERLRRFTKRRPGSKLLASLGQERYYSLLSHADAMVGNSSSGIWEAPSFRLPAVDIGERQRGRHCARNVIHAPAKVAAIRRAISEALAPRFRASLRSIANPYGDGRAAPRIVAALKKIEWGPKLLQKRFLWRP